VRRPEFFALLNVDQIRQRRMSTAFRFLSALSPWLNRGGCDLGWMSPISSRYSRRQTRAVASPSSRSSSAVLRHPLWVKRGCLTTLQARRQFGDGLLQTLVLAFEILVPFRLVELRAAVLTARIRSLNLAPLYGSRPAAQGRSSRSVTQICV
jgi:hypothetical protein